MDQEPSPSCVRAAIGRGNRCFDPGTARVLGVIYLDACLLIYLIEAHPRWGKAVAAAIEEADTRFGISPLVKCECLVGAIKRGDPVLQRAYTELFDHFVSLTMPEPVYLQAAELRARFGLKTPDALHLACAQHHRCDALWTNDGRLTEASHGLAKNALR
ncbi:MAG: type II toxin-antitoxin system VapC family toxin [Alphaproteobacteria bacterium]|nr:MAG: type II toxin-antitoxin system VapC family toxin [Alphaproteobacteria bacterium]